MKTKYPDNSGSKKMHKNYAMQGGSGSKSTLHKRGGKGWSGSKKSNAPYSMK